MGWGEPRKPPPTSPGTTRNIELAVDALAAVGITRPTLAEAAIEAAGVIDRLRQSADGQFFGGFVP